MDESAKRRARLDRDRDNRLTFTRADVELVVVVDGPEVGTRETLLRVSPSLGMLASLPYCDNLMIQSFGNALAEELYDDAPGKAARGFPGELWRSARRKLQLVHEAEMLDDLRAPPGNRLEKLKGALARFHSIRINNQWRIVFRWEHGHAYQVSILDYH